MLTNFHTHHHYCQHACGNVEDYVLQAIKENYDMIGISDHAPLPKYYFERMKVEELPLYLAEIDQCKNKYQQNIVIKAGLEIEYFPEFINYYKQLNEKLDYLILAIHDFIYKGKQYSSFSISNDEMLSGYFETLIKGIKSKLFTFAAHPDLFAFSYHFNELAESYTRKLAQVCLEENFILEYNANGFRREKMNILGEYRVPYPYKPFWDIIKSYQVKVIVNSDCHNPKYLNDEYDKYAKEMAISNGLNIVETIF